MFIGEMISKEDKEKYKLANKKRKYILGGADPGQWVIDRDREIYLTVLRHARGDRKLSEWELNVRGEEIHFELELLSYQRDEVRNIKVHKRITGYAIPENSNISPSSFYEFVKEGLEEYKNGVGIDVGLYQLTVDMD